jgi:flagellin
VAPDSGVSAQKGSSTSTTLAYTADTDDARTLTINNVDVSLAAGATEQDVVDAVNGVTGQTGVTAEGDSSGNITFSNNSGADITMAQDADPDDGGSDDQDIFAGLNPAAAGDATSESFQAGLVLSTDVGEDPTLSTDAAGGLADLGLNGLSGNFSDNVLSNANVLTGDNATDALGTIDFALSQVNGLRAELGAVQSRFENTITNLETTSENLSAARSRIQDADFAAETASLTQAQILQQAGISALSQANAAPQNVLSLLN